MLRNDKKSSGRRVLDCIESESPGSAATGPLHIKYVNF